MHANKIYNLIFEAVITLGTLERHVVTVHNFLVRPQRVFRLELLVTDLTRHRLSQRPDTKAQKLGTSTNFDKMKEKDVDIIWLPCMQDCSHDQSLFGADSTLEHLQTHQSIQSTLEKRGLKTLILGFLKLF